MTRTKQDDQEERTHLASRLASHLRYLREDATETDMTSLERLALVRGRVARMWEIPGGTGASGVPCPLFLRGTNPHKHPERQERS